MALKNARTCTLLKIWFYMKMEIHLQFLLSFSDSSDTSHSRNRLGHSDPNLPLSPRQEQLRISVLRELLSSPSSAFLVLHFLKSQQKTKNMAKQGNCNSWLWALQYSPSHIIMTLMSHNYYKYWYGTYPYIYRWFLWETPCLLCIFLLMSVQGF